MGPPGLAKVKFLCLTEPYSFLFVFCQGGALRCGLSPKGRGFGPLTSVEKEKYNTENNSVSISYAPGAKS